LLIAFIPVAALLSVTPGAATALVVRSAALDGRSHALRTTIGNCLGVLVWALLAALGVAAVVASSVEVYAVVKLAGAAVLVVLGIQSLRARRADPERERPARSSGAAFRDGLLTSLANPKLAVFFVALFPQFVPAGTAVLPAALVMAGTIVAIDLVYYSALAYAVARAKRAFVEGPWLRRAERLTGAVLVGLGVRMALERRPAS
jgi:threonine/homoserine/homoserine lactone efflux protein